MNSVRQRLLLGTAAATIAIFCAAAGALYLLSRQSLVEEFDGTLRARIQMIASMTEFDLAEMRLDADDTALIREFQPGEAPEYFEIATEDERHVVRSASLEDLRLDRAGLVGRGSPAAAFVTLPDGRPGRAMLFRARTQPDEALPGASGPDVTFVVAKSTAQLDRQLARLRWLLITVCGLATASLVGVGAWVISRAMRPVDRLALDISSIGASDLAARLQLRDVPHELVPVVNRLNALLARLQTAFQREKCFTSDAAHELRTPLAGIQTALEVCANERREPPQYERVVRECLRVTRQMNAMIDNLLTLARADAGSVIVTRAPVRLGPLLRDAWIFQEGLAAQRRLRVAIDVADDIVVDTDASKLSIILNNLCANAARYADDAGDVRIAAQIDGREVRISMTNTGSRVRAEDAERVFDRFWRGDAARRGAGRNCGLGLAVCRKLADALGASIRVTTAPGGIFAVDLTLPQAACHPARDPLCV